MRRPRVSVGSEGGDKDDRRRDKGVRSSVCGEEDLPTSEMRAMPDPGNRWPGELGTPRRGGILDMLKEEMGRRRTTSRHGCHAIV